MQKIDLKRKYKQLYQPSAKAVVEVELPSFRFLMIDGVGDPNTTAACSEAVEALFAVSYRVKFMLKRGAQAIDYGVMPLEGLWWAEDISAFANNQRDNWQWCMMIMQPDFVTAALIEQAMAEVQKKRGFAVISRLRLEQFEEGRCAQIMHVGPFNEEGPTIEKVHGFIAESGALLTGKHHEIYLSDIRDTPA